MDTIRKWRAAAVMTSVLFEGKSGENDAEQDEEEFVVHAFRSCGVTSTKASTQKIFSRLLTKTRKETNTLMLQRKKKKERKKASNPLVCSCIAEQFSTSCRVPATVNRHKPT